MARLYRIKITFWRVVLGLIILTGLYATIVRFSRGLGAASNLSDSFPWGIWIGFDILCGVALAAGGFTLAAAVYVFGLERYRPILRASILTAFLGYVLAIVSLLFDIGQPWRIWHPMLMWNPHSPMFEVAMCVMTYTTVLALEFSPAVFEWLKLEKPLKILYMLTPPLVIVGVLLSTMHQSTLGTLFVIAPGKLHGLWYTPFLPVLFYISAIGVGLAMIIFESSMSHRAFGTSLHNDILAGLSKAIPVVLTIYLVLRFITIGLQHNLGLIFEGSSESYFFLLETILGFALPIILFLNKKIRESGQARFYTALLVIIGVILNRLNVSITGMSRYNNFNYFPSFLELMTTVFVIATGMVAFGLIVHYLPIFPAHKDEEEHAHSHGSYAPLGQTTRLTPGTARPRMATPMGIVFLGSLSILFIVFGYWIKPAVSPKPAPDEMQAAAFLAASVRKLDISHHTTSLKLPEDFVFPESDLSQGKVIFSHDRHVAYGAEACTNCHPKLYPMAKPTGTGEKFHNSDRMYGCANCHDGIRAFSVERECAVCHGGDPSQPKVPNDFLIPSQSNGVGSIKFSHRQHILEARSKCTDCHPRPFEMVSPGRSLSAIKDLDKRMAAGHQCSKCHNGKQSFSVDKDCKRCHSDKPGINVEMASK